MENKNKKDEKSFKERRKINKITTAAILLGCVALGAAIPLIMPAIGGAFIASGISILAPVGFILKGIGDSMAFFGMAKACLIGGAIGTAIGGAASFGNYMGNNYRILKDENKALKENKSLTEPLGKVANNKDQVKISSPQEVNENVEKENELAR